MKRKIIVPILLLITSYFYANAQVCQWAERMGGLGSDSYTPSSIEQNNKSSIDDKGNVYITGRSNSEIFNFNNSITLNCPNEDSYSFFTKYNSKGICQLAVAIKGHRHKITSICADKFGNIYIAGSFLDSLSLGNNIKLSVANTYYSDNQYGFIAKYSPSGACIWAKSIVDMIAEVEYICIDDNGNVFVAGTFDDNVSFSESIHLHKDVIISVYDFFTAKYNSDGNCQWANQIVCYDYNRLNKISTDSKGNFYVVGYFYKRLEFSKKIFLANGSYSQNSYSSGFIAKYNIDGVCEWANTISSEVGSSAKTESICFDKKDNIWVAGSSSGSFTFFNNEISIYKSNLSSSGFIAQYNSYGACQIAKTITKTGGWNCDWYGFCVDSLDNFYVASLTNEAALWFNDSIRILYGVSGGIRSRCVIVSFSPSLECRWAKMIEGVKSINILAGKEPNSIFVVGDFDRMKLLFNNGIELINASKITGNPRADVFLAYYNTNDASPIKQLTPGNNSINILNNSNCIWHKVSTAANYRYNLSTDSLFSKSLIDKYVTDTNIVLSNLQEGKEYFWRVKEIAYAQNDSSSWSEVWSFKTVNAVPTTPFLKAPTDAANNVMINSELLWRTSENAQSYRIQVSISNTFINTIVDEIMTGTSKILSGLDNSTQYFWRVQAINGDQTSSWSEVWSFTTESIGSVDNEITSTAFTLTPSPATDEVNIQLGQDLRVEQIKIFNLNGEIVAEYLHPEFVDSKLKINVNELPNGIYSVVAISGNKSYSSKMIITR